MNYNGAENNSLLIESEEDKFVSLPLDVQIAEIEEENDPLEEIPVKTELAENSNDSDSLVVEQNNKFDLVKSEEDENVLHCTIKAEPLEENYVDKMNDFLQDTTKTSEYNQGIEISTNGESDTANGLLKDGEENEHLPKPADIADDPERLRSRNEQKTNEESGDEDVFESDDNSSESESNDTDNDSDFALTDEDESDNNFETVNEQKKRRMKSSLSGTAGPSPRKRQRISGDDKFVHNIQVENHIVRIDEEIVLGKNAHSYKWRTKRESVESGKKSSRISIHHVQSGPMKNTEADPLTCFSMLLDDEILQIVVQGTNEEISFQQSKYKVSSKTLSLVSLDEIKAFVGVMILSGAMKHNNLPVNTMFDDSYCGFRYKATMSRDRFNFLLKCLTFDDIDTRQARKLKSKMAPINYVWDKLVDNCRTSFRPGYYCTVGEQFLGFKGDCPIKVRLDNICNKYGVKTLMLCDSATNYMVDAVVEIGQTRFDAKEKLVQQNIEKIIQSIKGSSRNVTFNKSFSSIPLAERLLDHNLTCVGAIKENSAEFPKEFKDPTFKNRGPQSTMFLFSKTSEITAVSFKPSSKNRIMTLISTIGEDDVRRESKKPELIHIYNSTKSGVNNFNKMCQVVNCVRKTKRWTLFFFFNMINIAATNSYIIYTHQFSRTNPQEKPLTRLNFMLDLHKQLVTPTQEARISGDNVYLQRELKESIKKALGLPFEDVTTPFALTFGLKQPVPRKSCYLCPKLKRMTKMLCARCSRNVCNEHHIKLCPRCLKY